MPFEPGNPKPEKAGRRKGVANKRTRELISILDAAGYCPVADLIETAAIARQEYDRAAEIFDAIQEKRCDYKLVPLSESTAPTYLKIMQSSAADIMPYLYPKRKSIEFQDPNGTAVNALTEIFKRIADSK